MNTGDGGWIATPVCLMMKCPCFVGLDTMVSQVIQCQNNNSEIQMTLHYHKRSRAEIRKWLKTDEGKKWLQAKIDQKNESKENRRKREETLFMKKHNLHFDCSECLAGIGKHCTNNLPDGCPSFIPVRKE